MTGEYNDDPSDDKLGTALSLLPSDALGRCGEYLHGGQPLLSSFSSQSPA